MLTAMFGFRLFTVVGRFFRLGLLAEGLLHGILPVILDL